MHFLILNILFSLALAAPEPPRRKPGLTCGGFSPDPQRCPAGQVCAPTQPPMTADFPGTCVLQVCGGKPNNGICPVGQVCVYNATTPRTDQPGRCMTTKLPCGDGRKCRSNWECLKDPKIDFEYWGEFNATGICIPPGSLVDRLD